MNIRKTELTDIEELQKLYEHARTFMADHGNPTQWGNTYPPKSLIEQDIRDGVSYVCEEAGQLLAVFFYKKGRDDTYAKIYEGQWLNEDPYGVVHRIASSGTRKGCASFCLNWALTQCGNLKISLRAGQESGNGEYSRVRFGTWEKTGYGKRFYGSA